MPTRVWTNSRFGRALGSVLGGFFVVLGVFPDPDSSRWSGWNAATNLMLIAVGIAVATAVWTSRLVLTDGLLTATNLGRSRSMPLSKIVEVDPSFIPFLGLHIKGADGTGIRTLITGRTWDELWKTRASVIADELLALARFARRSGRP